MSLLLFLAADIPPETVAVSAIDAVGVSVAELTAGQIIAAAIDVAGVRTVEATAGTSTGLAADILAFIASEGAQSEFLVTAEVAASETVRMAFTESPTISPVTPPDRPAIQLRKAAHLHRQHRRTDQRPSWQRA